MTAVLVTSRSFGEGTLDLRAQAEHAGLQIEIGPSHHPLDELAPLLADAEAWIAGTGPITSEHLAAAPRLKVIARYGVGVEAVDLSAARARGIIVTNTPGANADAVAELAIALMLSALRHVSAGDRRLRSGDWSVLRGRELGALTVGLAGFGRIGQGVARRLSGFAPRMLAADPFAPESVFREHGVGNVSLDELFSSCDVVTLHTPGGQVIASEQRVRSMRPGAVLINTARAELVDEAAVASALREGRIASFAADTLIGDTAAGDSPLLSAELSDRVTLTPHWGAQTEQAVDNMGEMALRNVIAVIDGEIPPNLISAIN